MLLFHLLKLLDDELVHPLPSICVEDDYVPESLISQDDEDIVKNIMSMITHQKHNPFEVNYLSFDVIITENGAMFSEKDSILLKKMYLQGQLRMQYNNNDFKSKTHIFLDGYAFTCIEFNNNNVCLFKSVDLIDEIHVKFGGCFTYDHLYMLTSVFLYPGPVVSSNNLLF